jgi:TPR repeat protein
MAIAQDANAAEIAFWTSVRDGGVAAELDAYLARYPDGLFADLARLRLTALGVAPADSPDRPVITECDRIATETSDPDGVTPGVDIWPDDVTSVAATCEADLRRNPDLLRLNTQIGNLYYHGRDYETALKWYRKAAEAGLVFAEYRVGARLIDAYRDEHAVNEGRDWLRSASEKGFNKAQSLLGLHIIASLSNIRAAPVQETLNQGMVWLNRAADQNEIEAFWTLIEIYEDGYDSIPVDPVKARELARRCFEALLDPTCSSHYAQALLEGFGGPQDVELAKTILQPLEAAGGENAKVLLGQMYELGLGARQDEVEAARRYRAIPGNATARYLLAGLLADGRGVEQDLEQAAAIYGELSDGFPSYKDAALRLAEMYETGGGVDRDPVRATELREEAGFGDRFPYLLRNRGAVRAAPTKQPPNSDNGGGTSGLFGIDIKLLE